MPTKITEKQVYINQTKCLEDFFPLSLYIYKDPTLALPTGQPAGTFAQVKMQIYPRYSGNQLRRKSNLFSILNLLLYFQAARSFETVFEFY